MQIRKVRDLTLVSISEDKILVIACDSCGSAGMKEMDVLKVPPYFTGRFTARVGIMEVLCAGAEIITLTDSVCCEMKPTGEEIIKGIKDELKAAGVMDIVLTGSTEENFPTYTTGLGVTVIGIADKSSLRVNNISEACGIISLGLPKVGSELNLEKDEDILNYNIIDKLLSNPSVYEIVPVGSKGIQYEANSLAESNGYKFNLYESINVDMQKSCGPATSAIAAVKLDLAKSLTNEFNNCELIGYLYKKL